MTDRIAPDMNGNPEAATPSVGGSAYLRGEALGTLRKRPDFLRAARARSERAKGFVVQARKRNALEDVGPEIRVGFTCSKKVGNAVARNRAKRRLRELARTVLPELGRSGWDYVLIGRAETTATRNFADMQTDLRTALVALHHRRPTSDQNGAARRRER